MNGKKICKSLREIRCRIAQANDIDFTPAVCTHEGNCSGTCPCCESELRYIERQLLRRTAQGKKVALAGLALGAASFMPMYAQQVAPATPQAKVQTPIPRLFDAAPGDTTAVVVRGKVVEKNDKYEEPLIGAAVILKGTKLGTATDIDGNFAIRVPKGSILVISYVGYETQEYEVKTAEEGVIIAIEPKESCMGEVEVIAGAVDAMPAVDADIYLPGRRH